MYKRRVNAVLGVTLLLLVQCLLCISGSPQAEAFVQTRARHQVDQHALAPRLDYAFRNQSERNTNACGDDQNRPSLPNNLLSTRLLRGTCCSNGSLAVPLRSTKRWLIYQSLLI